MPNLKFGHVTKLLVQCVEKSRGFIVNGVPQKVRRPKPEDLRVFPHRVFPYIFILLASRASIWDFFQPMDSLESIMVNVHSIDTVKSNLAREL